ncbi:MAG: ShlB/FhaC/HecB family hemolysin secretion/activation protein [Henriciella sp.]|uniref:ShlB/FhaC/HecB family hemolysin secretion/activation protein n=1 Tax=Henriciella sp. TaxID=1968823 RepID=UPI003C73F7BC
MRTADRTSMVAILAIAGMATAFPASAQDLPDHFRSRLDPERERTDPAAPETASLPTGTTQLNASIPTGLQISTVNFRGVPVPAKVARAAEPYIGRPLTSDNLQTLVDALSDAYRETDVALFTLVVPEQDFEGGNVDLLAAEGYVEQVKIAGDLTKSEQALVASHAARLTKIRPASRAVYERNLLLLDDVPGLTVSESLAQGSERGGVKLRLDAEQKRTDFSVGYDSRTTRLIDQGQVSGEAAGYGLLRAGDQTRLNLAASTDFEDFRYASLQHSTPLGTFGTRASVGAAELQSFAEDSGLEGRASLYSLGLSHPFVRSSQQNLRASLVADVLNSNNAAFGSLLSTERTRALRGRLAYDWTRGDTVAAASVQVSQGFDVLEARISQPVGELEFLTADANIKLAQRFADQYYLRLNLTGQWSDDPLPANERFSVGGPNYGRAFENGVINADTGAAALVEAAYRPLKTGKFADSEVYAFADYATVGFVGRDLPERQLGSAGAGIRAAYSDFGELGLEAAKPYETPSPDDADDWQFNISWRITFDPR